MTNQEKPQELCYAVEFDDYSMTKPGRVEVRQETFGLSVQIQTENGKFVLLDTSRDQFGVFLMWGNRVTAAQEDNTRSCIDAVILALQFVQRQCEITKPPTVVVDTTEQPQEPQGPSEQKAVVVSKHGEGRDFLSLMRDQAVRAILKEEDRRMMEWVNSQPVVDAVAPAAARPTLDTVWNEIQRLISVNARHRRGFTMQECDADKTLDRSEDEFEELIAANAAAKPMELGDTVSVLLYYAHCLGLTQHDLAELMLEKFKLRFTEG